MRKYSVQVPANGAHSMAVVGNFVRCNVTSAPLRVRAAFPGPEMLFELDSNQRAKFEERFTRLEFENNTGSVITAVVVIGVGDFEDSNFVGSVAIETNTGGMVDIADDSVAAAATEIVMAARVGRRSAIISNLSTNTAPIRVGTSNAGAARGAEVMPGFSATLDTEAAIYVYNSHSAAQSVGLLEILA